MKTIEEAAYSECPNVENESDWIDGFTAGAEFAQQLISVDDELPEESKFEMSEDVLTLAGSKYSVKCYDYSLGKWSGSPHVTVTHWRPINLK